MLVDWSRFAASWDLLVSAEERYEAEQTHDQRVAEAARRVRRKRARRAMRKLRALRGHGWPPRRYYGESVERPK